MSWGWMIDSLILLTPQKTKRMKQANSTGNSIGSDNMMRQMFTKQSNYLLELSLRMIREYSRARSR